MISSDWVVANAEPDGTQRAKQIEKIKSRLPTENKTNIEFLFDFLARLNSEEVPFPHLEIDFPRMKSKSTLMSQTFRFPGVK